MAHKSLDSYDHYVSRTYLKHFSDKPEHVFVHRKRKEFEKSVAINSICGSSGGDICDRFENKFGLREILANIEPAWNIFIESVKNKNILTTNEQTEKKDGLTLLIRISLYIAYLRCLSPFFNELAQKQQEDIINNDILPIIAGLKNTELLKEALQLIKDKKIKVSIDDEHYFKAMGINFLTRFANDIYKRDWEILENKTSVKFITCDAPIILLQEKEISLMERVTPIYLPLTSDYAILIHKSYGGKILPHKNINSQDVKKYNKLIVEWASDIVISSTNDLGISKLVDKYRNHTVQIEYHYQKIANGKLVFFRHVVKPKNDQPPPN